MPHTNRRTFLKTIPAAAAGLYTLGHPRSADAGSPASDALYQRFREPLATAKPFYRWWWNDNRVTETEVRREIQLLAYQGAGGVEINPIALPDVYPDIGGEALEWLSPEWNKVLLAAVDEADKHGMIVDMIIGTGWPFGGKFLNNDECIQGIELDIERLVGPAVLEKRIDIPTDADHKIMQVTLFPAHVSGLHEAIDLTDRVDDELRLSFTVPPGEHDVYILTWRNKFREVMFGAKGADGPVLDHFNKTAVEKYLNRTSDALNPLFGGSMGNAIRAAFVDSIELEGANWTGDLVAEFQSRRGYDVTPYLPLLLNAELQAGDAFATNLLRVRYDHSRTLAELFMERFILPYHQWCHRNGMQSRYQAYGHPWLYTDLLDGYLIPDIPESDQWLYNPGWVHRKEIDEIRYAIWNKYASSGGHLKGRRIISCEAMTNTRGVFEATLEYIKQATDINTVGGINHLVLHGFNYSPPKAGFPGWIRFGTYFNEHNSWWEYTKLWSDYAARLGQIFQDSQYTAQIAIMGPTTDVWQQHGLDRNPWNTTPPYLHELWQALNHNGYCSDYINATILNGATFQDGTLRYGPMQYNVLLCADLQSIETDIAEQLQQFVRQGGHILFINTVPEQSPGLAHAVEQDARVKNAMQHILSSDTVQCATYNMQDNLTAWIGHQLQSVGAKPAVHISQPDEKLYLLHHRTSDQEIYFFSNMHRDTSLSFIATYPFVDRTAWLWDAETGTRQLFAKPASTLEIELDPLEAKLLVFENEKSDAIPLPTPVRTRTVPLQGPWSATFHPVQGEPFSRESIKLTDLSKSPDYNTFSGHIIYTTTFQVTATVGATLDVGAVYDIAEVTINGHSLGVRWWGTKQFDVPAHVLNTHNTLEIKVTTTLFNYCQSQRDNQVIRYWLDRRRHTGLLPTGLVGPVEFHQYQV